MSFGRTFLEKPELFPASRSGEPWGDGEVLVDLEGGPYRFHGLSGSQEKAVRERLAELCVDPTVDSSSFVDIPVFRAGGEEFRQFDQRGWHYAPEIDFQPRSVRVAGLDFMGRIDWTPHLQGALWCSVSEKERFSGAFENYFRMLFSYRIIECGGALIHSAGIVDDGAACLFVGPSGAGKTTISRLSVDTGRTVLSDDLNAICPGDQGPEVEKVPFYGDLGPSPLEHKRYPLRRVFRLEKSTTNGLRSMGRAQAIASLLACSPNVNRNPYRQDLLVSNLEALIQEVPAHVLMFSREGGLWDVLESKEQHAPSIVDEGTRI
jgi:hypothetical protein